jgi:RHS repeat-associated protein
LKRLTNANCGSVWSQTFSYDPFGNVSSSGSMSFQPTYSVSTNQIASVGGFTPTYDADGNTTADPSNTYAWDSNGRPVTLDGVGLTYDALGRMVEQNRSGVYTQIVYGPNGSKFAIMSGSTLQKAFVRLPGGSQAVYNSSGLLYYGHSDHLGSIRLGSSSTRSVVFDLAYAPFGETYATSGSTDPAFTSQRQDTVANIYDFPAREYNNFGRWASPDPSGLSAVHTRNPETLNRYAYVSNSPLAAVDPQGLQEDGDNDAGDGDGYGNGCAGGPVSDVVLLGSSGGHAHAYDDGCNGSGSSAGGTDSGSGGGEGLFTLGGPPSPDPSSGGSPIGSGSDCDNDDPDCGPSFYDPGAPQNPSSTTPGHGGGALPAGARPSWCPEGDACDPTSNPPAAQPQPNPSTAKQKFCFYTSWAGGAAAALGMAGCTVGGTAITELGLGTAVETAAGASAITVAAPYLLFGGAALWIVREAVCVQ